MNRNLVPYGAPDNIQNGCPVCTTRWRNSDIGARPLALYNEANKALLCMFHAMEHLRFLREQDILERLQLSNEEIEHLISGLYCGEVLEDGNEIRALGVKLRKAMQ
jgi:hypothetical protein